MARTLTIYQGEDQTPATDITDMVEWPDCEFGQRAYLGEGTLSAVRFRDVDGVTGNSQNLPAGLTSLSLAAHNVVRWTEGSNTMFRGRVSPKDYSRGAQVAGRAREAQITLDDYNKDLHNIVVHDYVRPAETDKARVQGILASYLSGNPRVTTNLNGSNFVSSSNTVTLPAITYTRTTVLEVLTSIATAANKQWFVTIDGELFYDGNDSTVYASPLKISDRDTEVNNVNVFAPIWDVGPASTEDGQQLLSGIWLFYGESDYVHVTNPTVANQYSWWEDIVYDDTVTTAAQATVVANAILARRQYEERTYNVSIGPLHRAQWGSLKHGQLIQIKAAPIPDADDAFVSRRITELRWTPSSDPESLFAHMTLDRPLKANPYGPGQKTDTVIPRTPPICLPDTPGTDAYRWSFTTNTLDDATSTYVIGLFRETAYWAPATAAFDGPYGRNKNANGPSNDVPITAGTVYTISGDVMWEFDPNSRDVRIQWRRASDLATIREDLWIDGTGHATSTEYHEATTYTAPTGADRLRFIWPGFKGIYLDNIAVTTAGTAADNHPDCIPEATGDSPFVPPFDDSRFTADDQHLISRVTQRVTNNSGVTLSAGDVVVPDITIDGPAVTRTTTASSTAGPIGVIHTGGAAAASVVVLWSGAIDFVNTNGTPADGDYLFTSTTAGAADRSTTRAAGAFGRIVRDDGSGETLHCLIWGVPDPSAGAVFDELNDLTDVVISSPSNKQVLAYDGTDWDNRTFISEAVVYDNPAGPLEHVTNGADTDWLFVNLMT